MFTDLPLDLESEILSRVPATSLQKLQTTCKRWYALFRDPKFVKKNFGKAATQVILQNGNGYSVTIMDTLIHSVNLHGIQNSFDPSIEVACKLNSWQKDTIQLFEILIHCEGLLLCATNDEERLVFWNPCTGQTKWIHCNIHRCYGYALGYETNNKSFDSYKLLIFDNFRVFSPPNFFIYELNSYSWWSLEDVSPNFFIDTNGVTLKGNAYWFASDKEDRLDKFILKFDFTTERFGRLPLPLSFKSDYVDVVLSVVREEKLALLQRWFDLDSLKMNIWVTKTKIDEGKDLSWINFLVVDFGKFVLPMTHNMTFLVDEKNKMVVCCDRDIDNKWGTKFYFAKEGIQVHQEIAQETKDGWPWPFLFSYVPSLVQIH